MPSPELVWIIDDDQSIRWVLDKALAQADLHTCVFDSAEAALAKLAKAPPSAILTDIRMPGMDGLGLLAQVRQTCPQVPVIIMTAHSDLDSAIQSYQGGAFEYLPKPFDVDEAVALVRQGGGPGEGTALVAEQFGLDQVARDGRHVQRNKGRGAARAVAVQGLGDQLFAGA